MKIFLIPVDWNIVASISKFDCSGLLFIPVTDAMKFSSDLANLRRLPQTSWFLGNLALLTIERYISDSDWQLLFPNLLFLEFEFMFLVLGQCLQLAELL